MTARVGIRYNNISAVFSELDDLTVEGGPPSEYFDIGYAFPGRRTNSLALITLGVTVEVESSIVIPPTRTITVMVGQGSISGATLCGLCGNALGQTVLQDLAVVDVSDPDREGIFFDEYFVNPRETFLRVGEQPGCGM